MQASAGNRHKASRAAASLPPRSTPVSVLVPTLNESADLPGCLASLSFADEVVVINSGSTDATAAEHSRAAARLTSPQRTRSW